MWSFKEKGIFILTFGDFCTPTPITNVLQLKLRCKSYRRWMWGFFFLLEWSHRPVTWVQSVLNREWCLCFYHILHPISLSHADLYDVRPYKLLASQYNHSSNMGVQYLRRVTTHKAYMYLNNKQSLYDFDPFNHNFFQSSCIIDLKWLPHTNAKATNR